MAEDTGDSTLIEIRTGTWPAGKVVVGAVNLSNPVVTVREADGDHVVELIGECTPGDLIAGHEYFCQAEANRYRWEFRGILSGSPTAGRMRGRQFFHRVTVSSVGKVIARRVAGS